MPPHTPFPAGPRLGRRTAVGGLFAAGAAAVLTGCTHGVDRRTLPSPAPSPTVEPDVELAATVLLAEQRQLDLVRATVQRHPRLQDRLSGTDEVHQRHVVLLTEAVPGHGSPSPSASGTPGPSPSGSVSPAPSASGSTTPAPQITVPRDPRRALAAVARGEDELTLTGKRSAFAAESGAFARVLASMAAAAAQQSVLLRQPGTAAG